MTIRVGEFFKIGIHRLEAWLPASMKVILVCTVGSDYRMRRFMTGVKVPQRVINLTSTKHSSYNPWHTKTISSEGVQHQGNQIRSLRKGHHDVDRLMLCK